MPEPAASGTALLSAIDRAPLNRRYWNIAAAVMIASMLEFFDFFLIGFVVPILAKPWHLTFGESTVVLLSAGIGAIIGSFAWGEIADRWGRKRSFIIGILFFALGTGLQALTPAGNWQLLSVLRLLVGAGVGGLLSASIPLLIEFTPTRNRTHLASFSALLVPVGTLLASTMAGHTVGFLGWRGLFAVGAIPALLAAWVAMGVPESPRWLLSKGRYADASAAVAWLLKVPAGSLPAGGPVPGRAGGEPAAETGAYRDLHRYPKAFWFTVVAWFGATTAVYGITLWGPTILATVSKVTPAAAADDFIVVSLGGLAGRIGFSFLPYLIGRRWSQAVSGGLAGLLLILAGVFHTVLLGGVSVFWILLIVTDVFADGGFANLTPYTPEVFPTPLRARAMGLAEGVNGIGKIIGPLMLGLIAGASNLVSPKATSAAVTPGFIALGAASLLVLVASWAIGPEPVGKALQERIEVRSEAAHARQGAHRAVSLP